MEVGFRQGPGKPVLVDDLRKLKFALTQENKKEKGVWLQDPKVDFREYKVQRDRQRIKECKIPGVSALAHHAVGPETLKGYKYKLAHFREWYQREAQAVAWETLVKFPGKMEMVLLEFMDWLYIDQGFNHSRGTQLLAALGHHYPLFAKAGKSNLMPEVCRALQGWKRLHPTGARMPLPMPAVCGLACEMVRRGKTTMGWLTMAAADMYLRPGEAIALTEDMIIAPRTQLGSAYRTTSVLLHPWSHGRASKAGQFDDSVLLDSRDRPWMGDLMLSWKRSKAPRQQLATFTMSEWGAEFKQCCEILGLPPCHLYVLRHSGPSDDFLRGNRSMTQIKRRGRWSQDQTVRKYEKAARSLAQTSQWPVSLFDHLQFCEKHVADLLDLRRVASIYQGPIPRGRGTGARRR